MRKVPYLRGARDIRNIRSAGIRAIPKIHRSNYLELYMLSNEKGRLGRECYLLDRKGKTTRTLIKSINKRMNKLQKETYEEQQNIKSHSKASPKSLKTMRINY